MGKEGTEIHFLLENLFLGGFFGGRYQLTDVLFFPLLIFPQDPEQRGMGRVYSVSFRVANDFSCPLDICPCDRMYHTALGPPESRVYLGRVLLSPLLHSHPAETWGLPLRSS